MMRRFREHCFKRYSIEAGIEPYAITFINKSKSDAMHPFIWRNLGQVAASVRSEFPHIETRVVSWAHMALKEQVQTVYETKILVSLPGSDVMNAVWLQDGATLIIVCRSSFDPHGADYRIWFRYFDWINNELICGDDVQNLETPDQVVSAKKVVEVIKKHQ